MKTIEGKYFCGNEISKYGQENGYVDYRTLAKAFDAVLCNDITKLFYSTINGEYTEPEMVNGYIDNSDEIADLYDAIYERDNELCVLVDDGRGNSDEYDAICDELERLRDRIEELEEEQEQQPEIYQYYIINSGGAELLQDFTNEIVYYIDALDMYIWGVTHWGTSWDYVLTDIKIDMEAE
jgi:hypothetical protein